MRKLKILIRRVFNPSMSDEITSIERYVIMMSLYIMKNPDSVMLMHPTKDRVYIQTPDEQVTVILDRDVCPSEATIVNHKYRYDVKMSQRAASILYSRFVEYTERRRDALEKKCFANTEKSMKTIYKETIKYN